MIERRFVSGLLVLLSCIAAIVLGKTISRGDVFFSILPIVLCVAVFLAFHFKSFLPAIALGMVWYDGGSPFIDDVPYVYYVMVAACGIAILQLSMRRDTAPTAGRLPLGASVSMIALVGVVLIFVAITALKKKGMLPASMYGAAGGLTYSAKYMLMVLFVWLLFKGKIALNRLDRIPRAALFVALFATIIDAINYYSPRSAFITYYLTTGINFEVMGVLRGATDSVLRLASLRELGLYLVLFLASRHVVKLLRGTSSKVSLWEMLLIGMAGIFVLLSGYRGFLIRYAIILLVFFWVYNRRFAIFVALGGASMWIGAVAMGDTIAILPLPVQRVLGSLPGVYKTTVAYSALGGIDWRAELFHRFFASEFWKHPWFGRGQVGDFYVAAESAHADPVLFFEVTQLWHSGVASALDFVGIIGALLLLIAQLLTLLLSIHMWRKYARQLEGWMVWCILYFYSSNIVYWYTGFFHRNFPMMALSMVGVFLSYYVLMGAIHEPQLAEVKNESIDPGEVI